MDVRVKQEIMETLAAERGKLVREQICSVIELSSSSSDSDSSGSDDLDDSEVGVVSTGEGLEGSASKKRKVNDVDFVLPLGFLAPLPSVDPDPIPLSSNMAVPEVSATENPVEQAASSCVSSSVLCKQFWKAGDYDGSPSAAWELSTGGMDHVRVHPKFLHSNATSHKWALGAFAELLDNSLDEACNGATYVNIDVLKSKKDGNRMLLIEDNGGGMDPDKMRHCMSLGYSAKSKVADTIGQYGNGFKTSTMRLGADVIVFSRCCGKDGKRPTQSIGLLSYTFLTSTGKEDIVVPMLDYEWQQNEWNKLMRSTVGDWNRNVETIVQWSPFSSEADLFRQLNLMKDHGTRIIIYNLWEDDQGLLELDFHTDQRDIQLRGVNRDEKNIQMAKEYPNSRHFLTYRHSLRSYASMLYLRLPVNFRIILCGKDVEHHNIVNDMMLTEMITYRPNPSAEGAPKDLNLAALVTIGFVKDAKYHIDVQGFNVYHKNRLIKPFWRVWNPAGSDGRGVFGVLEANFIEPAHDKQGFERTTVLARLETRLKDMQKTYWTTNCHRIGYAPRRNKKGLEQSLDRDTFPDYDLRQSTLSNKKSTYSRKRLSTDSDKLYSPSNWNKKGKGSREFPDVVNGGNGHVFNKCDNMKKATIDNSTKVTAKSGKGISSFKSSSPSTQDVSDGECEVLPEKQATGSSQKFVTRSNSKERGLNDDEPSLPESDLRILEQLKQENSELKERLEKYEGEHQHPLLNDLQQERNRRQSLELELSEALKKIEQLNLEQESIISIFTEERDKRDKEEEKLREKLKEASGTIQELLDKIKILETMKSPGIKQVRRQTL
ncbi:putative calmodulin binding protein [Hibiscus syriacus]|uniref:Calmodulin binding protein n=1 Tax=Hibiscus syriacus TaxID=106335 RepID=A0A6A3AG36_HIBSY|nr:protein MICRORCHIDIA 4-like isoform X2 [Hibiscus syriacus]KAE8703504.1 putative calmodulin binding protein [Hibiscus syriacus]